MRLVLFGAGASYGSERASPYCPPLGKGLFDELRKHYPEAWGKLPASDRPKFVPNFEPGMKGLWESGWHGTAALMRCMADYFARFRPLEGNTYIRLLDELRARQLLGTTVFSTLNYECLLEYAARQHRLTIDYCSPEPTGARAITVWKVHGSCNFLPAGVSGGSSAVSYAASATSWEGEVRIVDASQVGPFVTQSAFYPAMAVFMEGKPVHSNASLLKQLQSWWADAVIRAEKVGIIGVRPNEGDTHLWEPLSATDAEVVVIGDPDPYQAWAHARRAGKVTHVVGDRFAGDLPAFVDALA